ncbi:LacI family DNA-binding transcriptional regulator [Actinophytocola gossypii]|uniref:LacI family DNA-binding transcriptional regulator n=1 Tax=Actinophytocola gossypii TaxID=2812003 RepID=A0ABT2JG82_9PSEU|nr:LacI family DNA-binding transcriptional regulator [Actinophytocola gossypii]MCT2586883.1 LacI family DNA-binding transcriptional regulator [Actinophytocola gossypii]
MNQDRVRRPTLDTVARQVGVSRATVSNAYNRPDQLSARLRERIIETAKQLGYAGPDPVARSLATQRAGSVAFMLCDGLSSAFSDPALSIVLDALAATVDSGDRALLLLPGVSEGGPRAQSVIRAQTDVVVAYSLPDDAPALRAVRERALPLVVVDQPIVPGSAIVRVDDFGGARLAARHVLDLGHRRVAVLGFGLSADGHRGPATPERVEKAHFRVTLDRYAGYLDGLAEQGIVAGEVPFWEAPGSVRELGREGARWLFGLRPRPTAVLCMSDELALGAVRAADELGLAVPGEVSIVGFDDTPAASWGVPSLTTVRQDLVEKGRQAGALALRMLDGARPGRPVTIGVKLQVRGSTAPAPA